MFYDLHTIKDKSFRFYDVNSSDLSEVWCLKEMITQFYGESYGESHVVRKLLTKRLKNGGLIVNHF